MIKYLVLYCFIAFHFCIAFSQTDSTNANKKKIKYRESLNMLSIGYQIGGVTYFGAEYKYRFSKYVGLNAGAGITGLTAGIKLHSCPCRTGPFFNISFKDGGLGNFGSINGEIGGVMLPLSKNGKFGIMCQIGYGKIIYLTESYKQNLINQGKPTEFTFSFGVGLSWYVM